MEILKNLGVMEIQKYQRNRHPILFVDFIDEVVVGKSAMGRKNFSYNEWFFPSHFDDEPNVPGFIQLEMLTQVFLMTFLSMQDNVGKKTAFVKVQAEFREKIEPGDSLEIKAALDFYSRGVAKGKSMGYLTKAGNKNNDTEMITGGGGGNYKL